MAISDVLASAVRDLRAHLTITGVEQTYTQTQMQRVEKVVEEMEAIRKELDAPVDPALLESQRTTTIEGGMDALLGKPEPEPVVFSKEAADLADRATRK
jgi:hypothetical protein